MWGAYIMQVLVFDTSLDKTYITLALQDTKTNKTTFISKKIKSTAHKYHSAYLISQISEILENNLVELKNLDGIGVNIGPGSFTGIRVCLTVAKTLAQQLNLRLVGVSSCEILSKSLLQQDNILRLIIMDAKRGMRYYYNPNESTRVRLWSNDETIEHLKSLGEQKIITDISSKEFLSKNGIQSINFEDSSLAIGETLASIAINQLKGVNKINQCHWAVVKPLYVQSAPVFGGI